jgi:N-acetylneuraminic acid mutarotase
MGGNIVAPTSGVPSAANAPGGRNAFTSWTDGSGNLWLFGGEGFDSAGVSGYLNDLWEFAPSSQEWALMGGRNTVPAGSTGWSGAYGSLGTPGSGNSPGGREAPASWTDKNGNLWLFGGVGFDSDGTKGSLNDLWKFDPSTLEWVWVSGSSTVPGTNEGQSGVYGKLGTPAAGNVPGGRQGASSWTDSSGNLWLFGGTGYDSAGSMGSLNDLWEFDPTTTQWAWISGSSAVGSGDGDAGVYSSFGSPSPAVVPSGRAQAVSWTDHSGDLWLFGGKGLDSTGTSGYLNDLWEFNPASRQWAWMSGSNTVGCVGCGMPGIYGTLDMADSVNNPGGRSQAVGWTDNNDNFWLFGGNGYDSTGTNGALNDLWEFIHATVEWAWMGGSSTVPGANEGNPGAYGMLGVPAAGDTPGGRGLTGGWTDANGDLWLFGGAGYDASAKYGNLNDLWVYQPSPGSLPTAMPALSIASGTYSATQTVTISDATPGATIYYTTNGVPPNTGSSVYSGPITVSSTTTLDVIALANGYQTSAEASATYKIVSSFTIAVASGSSNSATVQPGGEATYSLVVAPEGSTTFPAAITLSASGLPPGSTATFSPTSISAGAATSDVSVSIQTGSTSASNTPARTNWPFALCLLFLPLAGIRRRRSWGDLLSLTKNLLAGILLVTGAAIAISGCSATVTTNTVPSTPTSYVVTVTAASGNVHKTTAITVTVQ